MTSPILSEQQKQRIHYANVRARMMCSTPQDHRISGKAASIVIVDEIEWPDPPVPALVPEPEPPEPPPEGLAAQVWDVAADAVSRYRSIMVRPIAEGGGWRPRVSDIVKAVSRQWDVSVTDILAHRRKASVVAPRALAMALAHRLTLHSLPSIGRKVGQRDHTTVLHHVRKLAPMLDRVEAAIGREASLESWVHACHAEMEGRV